MYACLCDCVCMCACALNNCLNVFLMQTGNLEFLVHFSGFSQFANRWIASADLRCGHKVREYMKENALDRIATSREWTMELKSIKACPQEVNVAKRSRCGVACAPKTEGTHSDDALLFAEFRHHKPRKISRRRFGPRPKRRPRTCVRGTTTLPSVATTTARRVIDTEQQHASLHQSSSSLPPNGNSHAQAPEVKTSSLSPSHLILPSPNEAASLATHHTDPINGQKDTCSNSGDQRLTLRIQSTVESTASGLPTSDSSDSLPPSPSSPSSESEEGSPGQRNIATWSTQPPGSSELQRNPARALSESTQLPIGYQSKRENLFKTPVRSVQSTVKYESESDSYTATEALRKSVQPTVNYDRNLCSPTRVLRRSDRVAVLYNSKRISYSMKKVPVTANSKRNLYSITRALRRSGQVATRQNLYSMTREMRSSSEPTGTYESWNYEAVKHEVHSTSHSFSDGMKNGSGFDSVSDLSQCDLEDNSPPSLQSGPSVSPFSIGVEMAKNPDVKLVVRKSCNSDEELCPIGTGRVDGKVPLPPLAPTSNSAASPLSLPSSSPDVYIVAVPMHTTSEPGHDNPPTSINPFTLENRHSVISHGEYVIFSQRDQQLRHHSVEEVTIPPASVGISSDTSGGNLSRDTTRRQPVAPPAQPSTSPPPSVVRRETAQIERPRNGLVVHRDALPTSSHLTCIGDVLISKRPLAYTPTKAINPQYQILLDAWEFAIYQVTAGKEGYVYIENNVDESQPPFNFRYITERIHSENVPPRLPRAAMEVCNCSEDCLTNSSQCCCTADLTVMPGYFRNGRIKGNHRLPIAECWTSCACGPQCFNRVVQRGRWFPLCIFRTENRGWGVKSVVHIPRGTFLTTYVGEVISDDEAEERGRDNSSQGLTYLFDLDYCKDLGTSVFTVDATNCGNVARFFNHSVSILCCCGNQTCTAASHIGREASLCSISDVSKEYQLGNIILDLRSNEPL